MLPAGEGEENMEATRPRNAVAKSVTGSRHGNGGGIAAGTAAAGRAGGRQCGGIGGQRCYQAEIIENDDEGRLLMITAESGGMEATVQPNSDVPVKKPASKCKKSMALQEVSN